MQCGLIGLPNVGKSTIFRALSSAPAEIANYPFCTIEPNVGIVTVPDERLQQIATICQSAAVVPTAIQFVDIAGLVAGASTGEGLGNRFLAHIRECNVICHVVRCFADSDITHVADTVDPAADFDIVTLELILADIETVHKRLEANKRMERSSDTKKRARAMRENEQLAAVMQHLEANRIPPYQELGDDCQRLAEIELTLLTAKKQIIVCNIDEQSIDTDNAHVDAIQEKFRDRFPIVSVCGKLESELAEIEDATERETFIRECGVQESGLAKLIHHAYHTLGLCTFFTAGKNEARAWTCHCGSTVWAAAGHIHTDFQKGFIKAEVYHYTDLLTHQGEAALRQAGRIRIEGKEYMLRDGDIIFVHAH